MDNYNGLAVDGALMFVLWVLWQVRAFMGRGPAYPLGEGYMGRGPAYPLGEGYRGRVPAYPLGEGYMGRGPAYPLGEGYMGLLSCFSSWRDCCCTHDGR
jgi:hypothetical protein